jgi:hypothetical protein
MNDTISLESSGLKNPLKDSPSHSPDVDLTVKASSLMEAMNNHFLNYLHEVYQPYMDEYLSSQPNKYFQEKKDRLLDGLQTLQLDFYDRDFSYMERNFCANSKLVWMISPIGSTLSRIGVLPDDFDSMLKSVDFCSKSYFESCVSLFLIEIDSSADFSIRKISFSEAFDQMSIKVYEEEDGVVFKMGKKICSFHMVLNDRDNNDIDIDAQGQGVVRIKQEEALSREDLLATLLICKSYAVDFTILKTRFSCLLDYAPLQATRLNINRDSYKVYRQGIDQMDHGASVKKKQPVSKNRPQYLRTPSTSLAPIR